MGLRNICKGQFKHHYDGSITVFVIMEEFMNLSYVNMYKFGFKFRNGPTNIRKSGKGVSVPCGAPIVRLSGRWAVTVLVVSKPRFRRFLKTIRLKMYLYSIVLA